MPALPLRTETWKDARCFVRHWDKIEALRHELDLEDDVLLNPVHFLASTDDTRRSRSVACWQGERLIGLMYVTEHCVSGFGTGYAVGGDYAGRGLLLCRPEFEADVVTASIEHLVSGGIHSLHLRLLPKDFGKSAVRGMKMSYLDALIPGDRMALQPSYEEFLSTLGRHTRRNVRNYTRKTEQVGIEFVPSLTKQEYQAGVERLNVDAAFRAEPLRLARDERLLALHSGAKRMGLRAADGHLVAVLCGFTQGQRFHLLTQLNDVHLKHLSLSIVLRGYAVEHLIASGHTELQFMGGTSLSFGRFCIPQMYRSIFADKQTGLAAAVKQLSGKFVKLTERMGRPAPEKLKMICNGHLEEGSLIERTAVAPAAVAFPRYKAS